MPRGGGRKVTHTHRFVLGCMRFRLWRDGSVAAVFLCRNEKKSNPSFFFLLSRASLSEESISSLSKMMIALSACAAEYSIGRSGFPKRSLLKRERETNGCVFRSPQQKQGKKREKTTHFDFTQRKEVQKRGKKNESTAKTYRRKKEKELKRKRERKRVFF